MNMQFQGMLGGAFPAGFPGVVIPMVKVQNPSVPLEFEKYCDGFEGDCPVHPELLTDIRITAGDGRDNTAAELMSFNQGFLNLTGCPKPNGRCHEAHIAALEAYLENDPVTAADAALEIAEVPEAYIVKAIFKSTSFEQALFWYNAAAEAAPGMYGSRFHKVVGEDAWNNHYLRSYVRAVHGQANTLRKLGKHQKAELKYKQLFRINPEQHPMMQSYVNWKFHYLEVLMKQGKYKEADKWARSKPARECYNVNSTSGVFFWTLALLEYICHDKRGFDQDYVMSGSDDQQFACDSLVGPVLRAFQTSPLVLEFLTGRVELPNVKVSSYMGGMNSWTNAAEYARAYLPLWRKTDGAIEWAYRNANSMICYAMLKREKDMLELFKVKNTDTKFEAVLKEGVYHDGIIGGGQGGHLLNLAAKHYPTRVEILLKSGAKLVCGHRDCIPPLLLSIQSEWCTRSTQQMIKYGGDPYIKTKHKSPQFAVPPAISAAWSGHARQLRVIFITAPPTLRMMDNLMLNIFESDEYGCITGTGPKCRRCSCSCCASNKSKHTRHNKHANFELSITALLLADHHPSSHLLERLQRLNQPQLFSALESQMKMSKEDLAKNFENHFGTVLPTCNTCGSEESLQKCSACKSVYYCSRNCQTTDWANHKEACKARR